MIDHHELGELDQEAVGMLAPLVQTFETVNVYHVTGSWSSGGEHQVLDNVALSLW